MSNVDTAKKPVFEDWHPADVVAAVRKAGWSLRRLSLKHELQARSLSVALRKPWPRAERIIAGAIGMRPQAIWPTRYHKDGSPKSGRGERGIGRPKRKHSTGTEAGNVHAKRAA